LASPAEKDASFPLGNVLRRTVPYAAEAFGTASAVNPVQQGIYRPPYPLDPEQKGDEPVQEPVFDADHPAFQQVFHRPFAVPPDMGVHFLYQVIGIAEVNVVGHQKMILPEEGTVSQIFKKGRRRGIVKRQGFPGIFKDEESLSGQFKPPYQAYKDQGRIERINRISQAQGVVVFKAEGLRKPRLKTGTSPAREKPGIPGAVQNIRLRSPGGKGFPEQFRHLQGMAGPGKNNEQYTTHEGS
jgi:hypothetical protein